jgi:ubiquinone/menaquinone biosynthesis C-methylase UbiE
VEQTLLPWALEGVDLGANALELGPGFGATSRLLACRVPQLTVLEVDHHLVAHLRRELSETVAVVNADATAIPFLDGRFSAVACLMMLHHVPSQALQDRVFAEAFRVLQPGAVFVATDGLPGLRTRLVHLFDTLVPLDPTTIPNRLEAAGFLDVHVTTIPQTMRVVARKPPR